MNKIEEVVLPLKNDAMDRAEQKARSIVAKVTERLQAAGMDRQIVAPYPDSFRLSRNEYIAKKADHDMINRFTRGVKGCRRPGEPDICVIVPELVEHYVAAARENAAAQYDMFVAKLNAKIGEVTDAVLDGNHVWSWSILTVTKADGSRENWKTQMILNVSKLGLVFNQFPTRKVK